MANLFDIFSKKTSRTSSVPENEQVSRFGARTPSTGDCRDGVNNPHSPYDNKDGAKGSGNVPAFSDTRFEKQEAVSLFTIPKLKKNQKDLLTEIPLDSREWQQEIFPAILKHFRNSSSSSKYDFSKVFTVHSSERMQQYLDKRREMRQNGYSERDVADSFAFLCLDDDRQVERVCREGLAIGNLTNSTIGHPGMGVQLCRYIDYLLPVPFPPAMTGKLLVFKIMKGRMKAVAENRTGTYLEPTPNCDSHIAKPALDTTPSSHLQSYEASKIYLFEYGDLSVEKVPRHVLPYAVVHFSYKEVMPVLKVPDSPPVMSPKLQSPLASARLSVSSAKEVDDPEYVIWCGRLKVKDLLDCQVKMVSTASMHKPARLGTMLDLKFSCDMKAAAERYFGELTCLRKGGEVYWKGWYINVAELRPRPDSKALFQRLRNYLCKTDTVAVVKPENDTVLLLVPDSNLTADLGLSRQHHFPVMLHCIFLSRQSAKFKSPRYMFKAMQNQGSGGSSTPRRDHGPLSPLSILVGSTSAIPVGMMSPLSGSAVHCMPEPSPTFRSSQRKEAELAVWAGLLSPNRTNRRASSSASLSAESSDPNNVPVLAHNLMRLHRSLSTDLASQDSSGAHQSIPLGYDEGFLMYPPSSALVNADRLQNAFEIQRQIQEEIESSAAYQPVKQESLSIPVPSITLSSSPSFPREQRRDLVQDDNITSSTSHDHLSISGGVSKPRSPATSPEKLMESEAQGMDDVSRGLLKPNSPSPLYKESQSRSRNLYLPPPGTPVYIPTPVSQEPSAKKPKLDDSSRYSSPSYHSERRTAQGSPGSAQRPSTPKVPPSQPLGLLQSRSGRDFPPLPASPADSSTDKGKPSTPKATNIDTADDMKNFLNAVLERKPSSVKSPSLSRSHKSD